MPRITIYTTAWCGFCVRAKQLLDARGYAYLEVSLDDDDAFRETVARIGGGRTSVPLITLDGETVGGYDDLAALDRSGELARRLAD